MESQKENNRILLSLNTEEALILFEWVSRFNTKEQSLFFRDKAEQRVLFDVEASLESVVEATFDNNYPDLLKKAWDKIRDKE